MVEGFRTPGKPAMDAVQIFLDGENQVDTSPAGTIEFHDGGGHDHWHFLDFGRYELTDAGRAVVRDSGKQAWCIANTDAVDLADDSAQLSVESMSLTSYCGTGPEEMWVREQLPSGWGDTYSPGQAGQVFDITDLENGTYFIKLTTNPRRVLVEADVSNNVSWRYVVLGGEPGARTVRVPPPTRKPATRRCPTDRAGSSPTSFCERAVRPRPVAWRRWHGCKGHRVSPASRRGGRSPREVGRTRMARARS